MKKIGLAEVVIIQNVEILHAAPLGVDLGFLSRIKNIFSLHFLFESLIFVVNLYLKIKFTYSPSNL